MEKQIYIPIAGWTGEHVFMSIYKTIMWKTNIYLYYPIMRPTDLYFWITGQTKKQNT